MNLTCRRINYRTYYAGAQPFQAYNQRITHWHVIQRYVIQAIMMYHIRTRILIIIWPHQQQPHRKQWVWWARGLAQHLVPDRVLALVQAVKVFPVIIINNWIPYSLNVYPTFLLFILCGISFLLSPIDKYVQSVEYILFVNGIFFFRVFLLLLLLFVLFTWLLIFF